MKGTPNQEAVLKRYREYFRRASLAVGQAYIMSSVIYVISALLGADVSQEGWGAVSLVIGSAGLAGLITFIIKGRIWKVPKDVD